MVADDVFGKCSFCEDFLILEFSVRNFGPELILFYAFFFFSFSCFVVRIRGKWRLSGGL